MLPSLLLLFWTVVAAFAARAPAQPKLPPGPRSTKIVNGVELWTAYELENGLQVEVNYKVNTPTRPATLVYNCAHVPALCNNIKQYLPPGVKTATLHYDTYLPPYKNGKAQPNRSKARRDESCPTNWLKIVRTDKPGPRSASKLRCPEVDQPYWKHGGSTTTSFAPLTYQIGTQWNTKDASRLYLKTFPDHKVDSETGQVTELYNAPFTAGFTCDEWPAATWIEGGNGASTYCAPMSKPCNRADAPSIPPDSDTPDTPRKIAVENTEQDWQGKGHQKLRLYFQSIQDAAEQAGTDSADLRVNYTIFKFNFVMETENGHGDAVYVKVGEQKRRCAGCGPVPSTITDCPNGWT